MLTARQLLEGLYAGHHGSLRPGAGLDFYDYRAYCPGDEVAQIDWKLFGRTNRYYLRQHRQPSDLHVYVMVDRTASMNFTGLNCCDKPPLDPTVPTKFAYAKILAAAIAMLTIGQNDRVGLGLFSRQIDHHTPVGNSWAHLQEVCRALEQTKTALGPGHLAGALKQASGLMRRRGLIILIADLLDEPESLFDGLNRLRHDQLDVIVFQILTQQELNLTRFGSQQLQLTDAETHQSIAVNLQQVSRRYNGLMSQHLAAMRHVCKRLGIDHNLLTTDQPAIEALRQYLVRRAKNRG